MSPMALIFGIALPYAHDSSIAKLPAQVGISWFLVQSPKSQFAPERFLERINVVHLVSEKILRRKLNSETSKGQTKNLSGQPVATPTPQ